MTSYENISPRDEGFFFWSVCQLEYCQHQGSPWYTTASSYVYSTDGNKESEPGWSWASFLEVHILVV